LLSIGFRNSGGDGGLGEIPGGGAKVVADEEGAEGLAVDGIILAMGFVGER
jgi:hypothetical protein